MNKEQVVEKVKKLMALAESDNEHEAALAAARVRTIMAKYHLSKVDIRTDDDKIVDMEEVDMKGRKQLRVWERGLFSIVSDECAVLLFDRRVNGRDAFFVGGRESDVEVFMYMLDYLWSTCLRLTDKYIKSMKKVWYYRCATQEEKLRVRASYSYGLMVSIYRTFQEQKECEGEEGLVLVKPVDEVYEKLDERGIEVYEKKQSKPKYIDPLSYDDGVRDGKEVQMRKGVKESEGTGGI